MQRVVVLLLLAFSLVGAGCSAKLQRQLPRLKEHLPARSELISVPFFPQKAYQCGPAALAMVLHWSGNPTSPDSLVPEVYTPSRRGSLQFAMMAAARRHGSVAYPLNNPSDLLTELSAGHPAIVLQNLGFSWFPVWHYAVAIGFDLNRDRMILHSGVTAHKYESIKAFDNTWSRSGYWGILVLPPDRLPVSAEQETYISAVAGLEKAFQWKAAVRGYRSALSRWPDSRYAHIGLGNSYYAMSDLKSAEAVLRIAIRRFPDEGAASNNLAQVLWGQGKQQEALEAAQAAVARGGVLVDAYRQTLKNIQNESP